MRRLLLALLLVLLSAWPASAARMANGTTDYLVSASSINLSAYTKGVWAAWIYADSYNNTGKYYLNFGASQNFGLIADQGSATAEAFVGDGSGFSEFTFTRPSAGAWHHIVVNVDWTQAANNKVTAVWVDAASQTLTNTSASAGAGPFVNGTLTLASVDGTSSFLPGREAEIAFWGGINFTQGDVNSLYNAGAGVVATSVQNASLKYYWQLCGIADSEPATTGGINLTVSGTGGKYGPIGITHPISGTGICTGGVPSINAASCSQNNVASAINLASAGDTVTIPAGDCTWTANIAFGKQITIRGAGDGAGTTRGCGSCSTIIRDGTTVSNPNGQLLTWSLPSTGLSSMSGIQWVGTGNSTSPQNGIFSVFGDGSFKTFRLHHLTFNPWGTSGMKLYNIMGVVDHCSFNMFPGSGNPGVYTQMPGYGGVSGYGDKSWSSASTLGTDGAMYFEDNDFIGAVPGFFQFAVDGWLGQRVVYRYNTTYNTQLALHGTETGGRERSSRQWEFYHNTIIMQNGFDNAGASAIGIRGGTGVVYENHATTQGTGSLPGGISAVQYDRSSDHSRSYPPWGYVGTLSVTNLTSAGTTATVVTASAHGMTNSGYPTGTGENNQVSIFGASPSGYNGTFPVTNILSATSYTYTIPGVLASPATGTIKHQIPFDGNTDTFGYSGLDQPGRGQSDFLGGVDLAVAPTYPNTGVNQVLAPVYAWNNDINGVNSPMITLSGNIVVENRDFFNGIVMPGYVPFTYPHPLVSGAVPSTFVPRHFIIRHRGP